MWGRTKCGATTGGAVLHFGTSTGGEDLGVRLQLEEQIQMWGRRKCGATTGGAAADW